MNGKCKHNINFMMICVIESRMNEVTYQAAASSRQAMQASDAGDADAMPLNADECQ